MYRIVLEFVSIDMASIRQQLVIPFAKAVAEGARVAQEAHQAIVDGWSNQPSITVENVSSDDGAASADVVVTDSDSSWWQAINDGSTSPGTSGMWMKIGPYNARSQSGDPYAGDGSKDYDGVIRSRGPSVIAPRDFIGYVVKNYTNDIIDAMTKALQ